jgi:two-component system, NarL family, sensor histidine kinase FusK
MRINQQYIARIIVLTILYIAAAKLGLSLASSVEQITTVWPPSGLALAALVLYGYRMWPGVFAGAYVSNLITNEPASVAFGIAIGNTLMALTAALLMRQVVSLNPNLPHIKDVVGMGVLAALLSTMVSATIGTASLAFGGLIPWANQPSAWLLWWFGDMAGVLLFAPFILVWHGSRRQLDRKRLLEFFSLITSGTLVAVMIFIGPFQSFGWSYFILPYIIWAAFRFKHLGVTALSLATSAIAILGTVSGRGPFAGFGQLEQQLMSLLLFIIVTTISGLFMAVAVLQREAHEHKLLAQATDLANARDEILAKLDAKSANERHLRATNESITKILDRLLDEDPR